MNIKHISIRSVIVFIFLAAAISTVHAGIVFKSPETRATLVELYTSEGCSSCPPADRWLSKLKHHDKLWKSLFPVAFHVDYWDYLGWKDEFADQRYSQRQYAYQKAGTLGTVYTPGMMRNGREWRSWRWTNNPLSDDHSRPGLLTLTVDTNAIQATFDSNDDHHALVLHIALLGMNRITHIKAGENTGRTLQHDFVVIDLVKRKSQTHWKFESIKRLAQADAIVAWITEQNDPTPIQVAGGKLK